MKRYNMIGCNDKIILKNQLNVGKYMIFQRKQSKSLMFI
jgi:hypothetical protein